MPTADEFERMGELLWLILSASRLGEAVGIRRVAQGYQIQGPAVMVRPADAGTPVLALERYLKRLWGLRTGDGRQRAGDEAADFTGERARSQDARLAERARAERIATLETEAGLLKDAAEGLRTIDEGRGGHA